MQISSWPMHTICLNSISHSDFWQIVFHRSVQTIAYSEDEEILLTFRSVVDTNKDTQHSTFLTKRQTCLLDKMPWVIFSTSSDYSVNK